MANINRSLGFSLFCLFLLCHGSLAQLLSQSSSQWQSSRRGSPRECRFDQLQAFEPIRTIKSQAGVTEVYDVSNKLFQCTGVSVVRRVIEPRGLLQPHYSNIATLVYIIQGSGITGQIIPGCPATYQQQFQQSWQSQSFEDQSQRQKFRDEHQKIQRFRQGDVVALPAGVAHWCYNDGEVPIVAIYVSDIFSGANQLDAKQRSSNGLDESFCAMRVRQNIDNPNIADTYNPKAGRITYLNNQKFPILNLIQMSAVKVNLYQNALLSPFWNINAHSIVYVTQGRARVQVVNNNGKTVFNGELRRGQLLIVPQHHVVLKKAQQEGCSYIAFKTNPNSMVSQIAGKNSILRALPDDVVANAYRISRDEAKRLKHNRGDEHGVFTPSHAYRSNEDVSVVAESS
ncbi:hypothetical protein GUJ93_ZPchr0001g30578 [Zizania palustris]|uniref:Cupin type-1 domain-containing protein n=1 Tax=Zizania palustris TaxID=103762 RepID=A0A8J5RSJ5_ZIZPA|nr:hypothetical protein GUJ93_ZPchr0001g30578 [Zizania palustris]